MTRRATPTLLIVLCLAAATLPTPATAGGDTENALRATWNGRWVILRTAALSDCDERYTNNRMRGPQPSSSGIHRFAGGEIGRIDQLHLQRARIDLLVTLTEPLRVEFRDGPFRLYEQLECRVELELPAPRNAVRQGAIEQLDTVIRGLLEGHADRSGATGSALWNRRRVEPLPEDHEERLAAYHAWKQEQFYVALRGRLAEALDRLADIAARLDRSVAYADGLAVGAHELDREPLFATDCDDLPEARFGPRRRQAPEELDGRDEDDWEDGFEDGQLLLFEIELARRLERCLP